MTERPLTFLFLPESACGPTGNCQSEGKAGALGLGRAGSEAAS